MRRTVMLGSLAAPGGAWTIGHLVEPSTYTLSGAGAFMTPSLRGTFQVAPLDGDCVTRPVTTGVFVAEVTLVRFAPPDADRLLP